MRAWTFVILRNAYLTDMRRNRFRGEYDEGVAERVLTAPAGQEEPIHLSDLHRALRHKAAETDRTLSGLVNDAVRRSLAEDADVLAAYVEKIVGDVKLARPMKIVLDCGHGVAGPIAPELSNAPGLEILPAFM